jgi:hypothetical protein
MQSEEHFISRQVRRAEERKLDKEMNRNKKRRLQQVRETDLKGRKTDRELAGVSNRRGLSIPVANLIGAKRICRGWFSPGQFK